MTSLQDRAALLDDAAFAARPVPQLPPDQALSIEDAYAIQALVVTQRLARGERLVGLKLGLTSKAKMKQVGVNEVILGQLTDAMHRDEGDSLDLGPFIHPRVEPEIAFVLRGPLPPDPTPEEALTCVEAVAPALEIIDSRYDGFRFDLGDVIADNASSAGYVLGREFPPETDIGDIAISIAMSDGPEETGSSAAILGHPLNALAAAGRLSAARGITTSAGDVVLAGAATAAIPLSAGAVIGADFGPLGRIDLRLSPPPPPET